MVNYRNKPTNYNNTHYANKLINTCTFTDFT